MVTVRVNDVFPYFPNNTETGLMNVKKIAIIGAGPAGLTVAFELLKQCKDVTITIFEKEDSVGGLAKTLSFAGNKVDIGGHRYFTKDSRVMDIWNEVMSSAGEGLKVVPRSSHILYRGKSFAYPLQINYQLFRDIGFFESVSIVVSYLLVHLTKTKEESLEDYYQKQFGKRLYQLFFRDYTRKVWGISAHDMVSDWGTQRVQHTSLWSIIRHGFGVKKGEERSLVSHFYYPQQGAGILWQYMDSQIRDMGGETRLETEVTKIQVGKGQSLVVYKDPEGEHSESFDCIISTMPLKEFVQKVNKCPTRIRDIANGLSYRSLVLVALEIEKKYLGNGFRTHKDDCWIYIQDIALRVGRIQVLNNWSEAMLANPDNYLIELEYFCDKNDELWCLSNEEILSLARDELQKMQFAVEDFEVYSWMVKRISDAYPVYAGTYDKLAQIRKWINSMEGIYCIGRNGQHHYNNMDHSMQTSYKVADYIRGQNSEKEQIWNVNMDSEYHEIKKQNK